MSYYRQLIQTDPYLANQIAYYPFDTNANDLINLQNGTGTNISYANPGRIGNSASFNGTSLISVADNNNFSFGTSPFSINMWLYINPLGVSGVLINKRDATPLIEYQLAYNITLGTLSLNIYSGGTTANTVGKAFGVVLNANVWQMVTVTSSGGTGTTARAGLKAYVNGVEITSFANLGSGTYTGMANTSAGVVFGRQGNTGAGFLNGRLDQTRIWNGRELSASEVTDIYNTLY
jgi:hypothetical protein